MDYETKYEDNYYLVKDRILSDMKLLKQELNKYFMDDIIDKLLNIKVDNKYPLYKEVNGKVYRFGGYVGQYDYLHRENNLSLEKVNDSKVIIHDKIVWDMEESQTQNYDYTLEKDTDGNFKFINFELPASFYSEI